MHLRSHNLFVQQRFTEAECVLMIAGVSKADAKQRSSASQVASGPGGFPAWLQGTSLACINLSHLLL